MKLLVFIAFFIVSYYIISKYLFPYLVKRFIQKAQSQFGNFGPQQPREEIKKEGEVSVKYVPPDAKKTQFDPGESEDVDFEEIKNK
jgi:hypothetical protein